MPSSRFTPFFLPGPSGKLFAVYHSSRPVADNTINFVYVPPFAEELNRSRRMASLQAQELASRGIGVLLLDLFGTGDSEGDFRDATWQAWTGDVEAAISWLKDQGSARTGLWGTRLGGLLAMAVACRSAEIEHVILWSPVASAWASLKQFLRIQLATSMESSERRQNTEVLRERLAAGETIEVAGYALTPALATSLEMAELTSFPPPPKVAVDWFELVAEEELPSPPAARTVVQNWHQQGAQISLRTAVGKPFWSLQSITVASRLIEATSALFKPESVRW